ncbi:succinate dehydrogenase cytochrome B subunit [Trypanosoma rangeli]|uniref:Succinate dehydrogenase cytochrome B subunit n=1 Tax=Trypanosoma rangeli TaxID=5698 RepID=A0A422N2Z8_TRYRA|nr:succinate dehydrogenase cytochrome B subunit [Trypanosoma rangeli]RNE99824.1 succinate dehydrogenase cytochrome B subunit [Trypanosoma rangeli]|eukprot:RNE99824.1 succinate dehydrogenase cytochrome B subunit [Trypanosoma rangeli]
MGNPRPLMPAVVKRPFWMLFLPSTYTSRIHRWAYHAPTLMFGVATAAILMRQSYYRSSLDDEDENTCDRIDRRAYIALPDGRMALVYPIIDTLVTPTRVVLSLLDAINPMP